MTRHPFLILSALLWSISRILIIVALLSLTAILISLACGCSRHTPPVEIRTEHHTIGSDSLTRLLALSLASRTTQHDKETVYVFRDRAATVNTSGDTTKDTRSTLVIRDNSHESDHTLYLTCIDSLRHVIAVKDSLLAETPVPIYAPSPLTTWQRIRIRAFWPLFAALLALLVWHRWGHLYLRRKSF